MHNLAYPKNVFVKIGPHTIAMVLVALIYFGLLSFQTAFALDQNGSDNLPLPVRVVLTKIKPLFTEKKYDQAIEVILAFQARGKGLDENAAEDPKGYHHPEIYYALGNCYLLKENYKPAAAAFGKAVKRDPKHTFAWLNLGKTAYELEDYAEAGDCFYNGYKSAEDKNPEHLYFSAAAYFTAQKTKRSIEIFEELLKKHPKAVKPEWQEHLVHALLADQQNRRALPYIKELVGAFSGDKQIQWQEILLHQYVQLDMRAEALSYARQLTRNAPVVKKWWKALAHIQLGEDRWEEALASLTIYSFLTPLSTEEKKLLADLNLQLGIPVKAAPVYEECLDQKCSKEVLRHLVIALRQLDKPQVAIEKLNEFKIAASDPELMLLKGELLYMLKDYDQAAAVYGKAAQKEGTHQGRAWLMAGYAFWQCNKFEQSKAAFTKAADFKKEEKAATLALKQLSPLLAEKDLTHQAKKEAFHEEKSRSEI